MGRLSLDRPEQGQEFQILSLSLWMCFAAVESNSNGDKNPILSKEAALGEENSMLSRWF